MRIQVNGEGEGKLTNNDNIKFGNEYNPNDAYLGAKRDGSQVDQYYARLQEMRNKYIKDTQSKVFGSGSSLTPGTLIPASTLDANATTKFQATQSAAMMNQMNIEEYGAKKDQYGAFSRSIETVNSFSYTPRDPFTFTPRTAFIDGGDY